MKTLRRFRRRRFGCRAGSGKQTFSPENEKKLRRFSSWEVGELIFRVNQSTLRGRLAADPSLPVGEVEEDGRQRWFTLEEINALRRRLRSTAAR
jgi:chromosome partitioning protein